MGVVLADGWNAVGGCVWCRKNNACGLCAKGVGSLEMQVEGIDVQQVGAVWV